MATTPAEFTQQSLTYTRMIDLSTGIEHQAVHEPWPPSIRRLRHDVEGPGVDGAGLRHRAIPAHPVRWAGTGVRGGHGDHALRHPRRRALALRPHLRRTPRPNDRGVPAGMV